MNDPSPLATPPVLSWTPGRLSAGWFWALFLGLFVITALPMLRVELPPFVDYPNHLARMHVLIDQPQSEALQQYYEIRWRPLPNLAMDVTVPVLARVMTLEWAGKVFVLICLALLAIGVAFLHRAAAGQWSVWPLFAFLFLYSRPLIWGFLNYLCGLGLALIAFALWLALAKRSSALRIFVASACAPIIFFAHLEACTVFALLIAGHEIGELWRQGAVSLRNILVRTLTVGLPFLAPLAIFLADGFGGLVANFRYEPMSKLAGLLVSEGHPILDTTSTVVLLSFTSYCYFKRYVTIVPAFRAPVLLLALAYLLAPAWFLTGHGIDERLPPVIMLLLAAGTTSPNLTAVRVRTVALAGLALFLVRVGLVEADFELADQIYPRLAALLDQVPRGGRLAVAYGPYMIEPNGIPINHLPTLAVIRRDAFVTTLFTGSTQQPVGLTPAASALIGEADTGRATWAKLTEGDVNSELLRHALAGFDALVVLDGFPFAAPATPLLVPIGIEPNFALYRIAH